MKNDAFSFASEVDRQIEALSTSDLLRHKNRGKILQEELLPISRLGLHLKQPGLTVEVEAFENKGESDGYIWVTGFREEEFNIQVTFVFSGEDALRREHLVNTGSSPDAGTIYRDKKTKKIFAEFGGLDVGEHISRISHAVIERFKDKTIKPYSKNTVLIIAFDEFQLYGRDNWNQLFTSVEKEGGLSTDTFAAIYLFNNATNELQKAFARRRESTKTARIYVYLLHEGTDVWRPAIGIHMKDNIYQIYLQSEIPADETWQFLPGELVRCEERLLSGNKCLVAIDKVEKLDE